jgi:hypothetical protein
MRMWKSNIRIIRIALLIHITEQYDVVYPSQRDVYRIFFAILLDSQVAFV